MLVPIPENMDTNLYVPMKACTRYRDGCIGLAANQDQLVGCIEEDA